MKKFIVDDGITRSEPLTEDQVKEWCLNGKVPVHAKAAPYIGFGMSSSFEPILSFPEFCSLVEEKMAELKTAEQRLELERRAVAENVSSSLQSEIGRLIAAHLGLSVMLNYTAPDAFEEMQLVKVTDEFFTTRTKEGFSLHTPISQIIQMVENQKVLLIRVNHLVLYKGAIGFGISFPLPVQGD
jgi:hypothetical protein